MKKIGKFIKSNTKLLVGIILGAAVSGGAVYAATVLPSSQVGYDNSTSGLAATDVQGALDELNTKADTWLNPNDMGTPQYYAFGEYKEWWCSNEDTNCSSLADFPTTSTTPPSGKTMYLASYADGQYGICIQRNGKEHCFRGNNYKAEEKHIQEVFSDISCEVESHGDVRCDASDFRGLVSPDGFMRFINFDTNEFCYVDPTHPSLSCSE